VILDEHPDHRPDWSGIRFIGYWYRRFSPDQVGEVLPDPAAFVDESWDPVEREEIARRLDLGTLFVQWMGFSGCRFECGEFNMGTSCRTFDGTWVWPEGFSHYIREHGVRPPQEFVDYLLGVGPELLRELTLHQTNKDAIRVEWENYDANDCPDKGVVCTYQESGYPRCKKGNSSSGECLRASEIRYQAYTAERARHQEALEPLAVRPWRH
jgi:hypothetical protein